MTPKTKLKTWYLAQYPDDGYGQNIRDAATFGGLYLCLNLKHDVYKYIGTKSQKVREVLFMRLSKLYNIPYSVIYKMWDGVK